jgi:AraC-like DNA-binding protein
MLLISAKTGGRMPLLAVPLESGSDWKDPDGVPRPVVAFGIAETTPANIELGWHSHRKGQILLALRGAFSCEVEGGLWMVPPLSAVWIPGGTVHKKKLTGAMEGYGAFVDPAVGPGLPTVCCVVSVTPLLRELLVRSAQLPAFYEETAANGRLLGTLLDELAAAKIGGVHLPMPVDVRLRKIAHAMIATPGDRANLEVWARRGGLSERTLERLLRRETGMSFSRWRQQLAVTLAVKWMADGRSLQHVTNDLGYDSVPSFVTMFRKTLGTSPRRYMAERYFQS